jgi:omega-6 fatty acid desaturase (delta-12 desaturase)
MSESTAPEPRSLGPVIEAFPEECYDNPTGRGLAYFARDAAIYGLTVAALLSTDQLWLVLPLWVLAGLGISALFIVAHDAAHGSLFKSDRLNYVIGQLGMLPSLHIFEMWCFGHNRIHHGHTTRGEMNYVWHPITLAQYRALSPLHKLVHRFKWSCLGGGFYYLWDIWWKKMVRFTPPERMAPQVRRDRWVVGIFAALFTLALLGTGFAQYGTLGGALWTWFKVFAMPFLLWNYSIGITVYVHHIAQDIPWHTRREWNKFKGQMLGTTILHVPRWLNVFYHNIFLHVPHHVDMRIPFYRLPAAVEALRKHYGHVVRERVLHPLDYWQTTRTCKLFDFERGVWCDYRGRQFAVEATLL